MSEDDYLAWGFLTRRLPGFTWVHIVVIPFRWRWGDWWPVRGIAHNRAIGPLRVVSMRSDCLERAHRSGMLPHDEADRP